MDSDEIAAHLLERMRLRILSPLTTLVGLDLIDLIDPRLKSAARRLAQQMLSDDEREAAQTVIDVMALLWPDTDPEDEDPTWWHTPLGQQVARSIGRDGSTPGTPTPNKTAPPAPHTAARTGGTNRKRAHPWQSASTARPSSSTDPTT